MKNLEQFYGSSPDKYIILINICRKKGFYELIPG